MVFAPPLTVTELSEVLRTAVTAEMTGRVFAIRGASIVASGVAAPIGAVCRIDRRSDGPLIAEVVGFEGERTILSPMDTSHGIRSGDRVLVVQGSRTVPVGPGLIGRVVDADGVPIDDRGPIPASGKMVLQRPPVPAMDRPPIEEILPTGVRALDAFLTIGKGQRIGIFAGSGVGKSTLLGMLARGTEADVVVIGLIGERGREVREFLERDLAEEGRRKSITVVATSDQPALRRLQAAKTATAIAEHFRSQGLNVLLLMDSVTRFAMAQREIGLAAGEAPATRGYPPSVFGMLPQLVERAGRDSQGSITGIYTVLVDGDDTNEPISDALRGLLDGHVHLSRSIAARGRYPAIDVLPSLSRLQSQLVTPEQREQAQLLRQLMAAYRDNEDLISIGAYRNGSNPVVDRAIAMRQTIEQFLAQSTQERVAYPLMLDTLKAVCSAIASAAPTTGINRPQPAAQGFVSP